MTDWLVSIDGKEEVTGSEEGRPRVTNNEFSG